ncbi:MAG: DUF5916 domain-containing protein [Xanthomonadales bacterium]|nr:DUF5916 domain-containing protein [Xanthomonadales bacterium]
MAIIPMLLGFAAAAVEIPEIPHIRGEITVDGRLDEPLWGTALEVPLPYETRPGENTAAPVNTRALIVDTGAALVIAFEAQDPQPEAIRAYLRDRDSAYQDDFVGVVLDTFNDERRALEFFANPLGAQMDLIQDDVNNREDDSWDAIWDAAGRITDFGYVVEMEIPYTALQIPDGDGLQTWGMDLLRFYPRDQRYRISNNPLDRSVSCYLCQLSKVRGFEHASAGTDLEITPTLTARKSEFRDEVTDPALQSADADFEAGVDVSWGVTPNITLNATLNPDFSQVEADVAQLDVNRTFALFFPERRPFFLEAADFFSTPLNAVFTRNVTDPDFGARVTGKIGPQAFGVFVAEDAVTNILIPGALGSSLASLDQSSRDAVLRYRRDVGKNSSMGVLLTARDGDGYRNLVAGIDGRIRFSDSDTLTFQYLDTDTEYPAEIVTEFDQPAELSGDALYLGYDHETRDWFTYMSYQARDPGFRADLGFLTQADFDKTVVGGGRIWHGEEADWYTRMRLAADWDITHDAGGRVLEREVEANFSVNGPLQSFLQVGAGKRARLWNEVLFDEDFRFFYGEAQPASGLYLSLFAETGDQIDFANTVLGDVTELGPQLRWNFGKHWQLRVRHTYQKLERDEGEIFTANQSDVRVSYQFNLRQRLRLTVQYTDVTRNPELYEDEVDSETRILGTQLIYSYKVNPRTVVFAGYSDSGLEDDQVNSLTTTNRTLFMKVSYAWEPTW